jgi:hypothetical protein
MLAPWPELAENREMAQEGPEHGPLVAVDGSEDEAGATAEAAVPDEGSRTESDDRLLIVRRGLSIGATGRGRDQRRYHLLAAIAKGGMGEVYVAELVEPSGERQRVVVKRLLEELEHDVDYVEMFRFEAATMARLDHPNIVKIIDAPVIEGSRCLAIEYVRGRSVSAMIERARKLEQTLPPDVALYILVRVLIGLDHVHHARLEDGTPLGLVHRDVTPGNLLVGFDGAVKITDFGIAKSQMSAVATTAGIVKGKARYLAPEQIIGEKATPRSDLFSSACVLIEMLSGIPIFERMSVPKTLQSIVRGEREPIEQLLPFKAARLAAEIERALSLEPARRHDGAQAFAAALEAAGAELGPPASQAEIAEYLTTLFEGTEEPYERAEREADQARAEAKAAQPPGPSISTMLGAQAATEVAEPLAPVLLSLDGLDTKRAADPGPPEPAPSTDDPERDPISSGGTPRPVRARGPHRDAGERAKPDLLETIRIDDSRAPHAEADDEITQAVGASPPDAPEQGADRALTVLRTEEDPRVSVTLARSDLGRPPPERASISDRVAYAHPLREAHETADADEADETHVLSSAPKPSSKVVSLTLEPRATPRKDPASDPSMSVTLIPNRRPIQPELQPIEPGVVPVPMFRPSFGMLLGAVFVLGTLTGVAATFLLRPVTPAPPISSTGARAPLPAAENGAAAAATAAPLTSTGSAALRPLTDTASRAAASATARFAEELDQEGAALDLLLPRGTRVKLDGSWLKQKMPARGVALAPGRHAIQVQPPASARGPKKPPPPKKLIFDVGASDHLVIDGALRPRPAAPDDR